jgi:hypothetical protein
MRNALGYMRNRNKKLWPFQLSDIEAVDLGGYQHRYCSSGYCCKQLIFLNNINCHLFSDSDGPITKTGDKMMCRRLAVTDNEDEDGRNDSGDTGHII